VRQLSGVPVPGEPVFSAVERLQARLAAVRALLTDPLVTSIRLVVNPEKVVVAEARRTATYLALFGYGLDAVVVNRVLPDEVSDPWFDRWRESQHALLDDIDAGFAPVPVLRSRLRPDEPVGVEPLADLAGELYGATDPAAHHHRGPVLTFTAGDGVTELTLDLPFTDRRDVALVRRGDELVVTVGPHRRAIVLPDGFAGRKVVDASVRAGRMTVVFADR
jgi:arsenite-transporting ATPase